MTNKDQAPLNNKKHRRSINARFLWVISVIAGIAFFITFLRTPLFPLKWSLILLAVLVVLFALTFLLSIKTKPKNVFTKIVNIVLCIVLFIGTILIPYEVDKVTSLIDRMSGNKIVVNVYRMNDTYATTNGMNDRYQYDNDNGLAKSLSDLKDAKFITSMAADSTNSENVLLQLKDAFGKTATTVDRNSYVDAAEALYNGDGDFLIMSASYESTLADSTAYENFKSDTQVVYSFEIEVSKNDTIQGDTTLTNKPFTIFFGGNDEDGALYLNGRTDVCMILTVNPNTHQIAMINMPRDSYIPNPALNNNYDKLTHLGLSGITNTLKGLGTYLDEPINNYVVVNFETFKVIIQEIGGVDIDNPYAFTAIDGEYFEEGPIHLYGAEALMYVRERENLPDGDFGRNNHQQIVMSAIIDKITSAEGIASINSVLDAIGGLFLTNVTSKAIYGLVNKQLSTGMSWNIVKYHILGDSGMEICASAPGQQLSVVYPYTNQIDFVKKVMDQVDAGDSMEQEELPDGKYNNSSK